MLYIRGTFSLSLVHISFKSLTSRDETQNCLKKGRAFTISKYTFGFWWHSVVLLIYQTFADLLTAKWRDEQKIKQKRRKKSERIVEKMRWLRLMMYVNGVTHLLQNKSFPDIVMFGDKIQKLWPSDWFNRLSSIPDLIYWYRNRVSLTKKKILCVLVINESEVNYIRSVLAYYRIGFFAIKK